jgi:hypothetical protein
MNDNLENLVLELAQIVSEAEKAVSNVKDSELKQIAYGRVLEHLLKTGLPESKETTKKTKPTATKIEKGSPTKSGPKNWVQELVDEGFFQTPRASNEIREALDERGHILKPNDLTSPLTRLVNAKVLRRQKKPAEDGGKSQIHWYNW